MRRAGRRATREAGPRARGRAAHVPVARASAHATAPAPPPPACAQMWIEVVHGARQAGLTIQAKAIQLWEVGAGLPLDALKKGTISDWACPYLLEGCVSPAHAPGRSLPLTPRPSPVGTARRRGWALAGRGTRRLRLRPTSARDLDLRATSARPPHDLRATFARPASRLRTTSALPRCHLRAISGPRSRRSSTLSGATRPSPAST